MPHGFATDTKAFQADFIIVCHEVKLNHLSVTQLKQQGDL